MSEKEKTPKGIKIRPPNLTKKERPEETSFEDIVSEEKEKSPPKTLFRKDMGPDATILLQRKRKPPQGSESSSQEGSSEKSTRKPLLRFFAIILTSIRAAFLALPLPSKATLGIITGILVVVIFSLGRWSAPAVPKASVQSAPPPHVEWNEKFRDGLAAVKHGDTPKALAIAGELAALNQSDAYYPAGWLFIQAKDAQNAEKNLELVSPEDRHASDAALLQAIGALKITSKYNLTPKTHNAEAFFQKAIAIDPLNVEAHVLYGVFLRAQGRNQSATDELKQAVLLSRASDTSFVYQILLKLAENDLNGPPAEPPANPEIADRIVESVNLWKKGQKEESVTLLKATLGGLPPSVQRTIIQDPVFKELPGMNGNSEAPKTSALNPSPAPSATPEAKPAGKSTTSPHKS